MTSYAVARLRDVAIGDGIVEYLERIDATLTPYRGRFVVHGGEPQLLEGTPGGDLVVLAFPSRPDALAWYHSPAYQAIVPLRTGSSSADIVLVDGVDPDHRATDVLP